MRQSRLKHGARCPRARLSTTRTDLGKGYGAAASTHGVVFSLYSSAMSSIANFYRKQGMRMTGTMLTFVLTDNTEHTAVAFLLQARMALASPEDLKPQS